MSIAREAKRNRPPNKIGCSDRGNEIAGAKRNIKPFEQKKMKNVDGIPKTGKKRSQANKHL